MAYTPFAGGPRGCIGYNIAILEAKMVLAMLVSRYRFVDATRESMVYDPEFLVLRPLNCYTRAVRRLEWPDSQKQ
jgi:cytochrome P450